MTDVKYPELPYTAHFKALGPGKLFTADQMRSYADATCALRGAQKESHAAPGAPQQEASGDAAVAYLGAALREQAVYLSRETVRTLVDGVLSRAAATAPAELEQQCLRAWGLPDGYLDAWREGRAKPVLVAGPAGGVTPTPAEIVDYCARHGVSPAKAKEALASAARAAEPEGDTMQVPRAFVAGFCTLAHNYSLRAVPPDYYDGRAGDAFSNAYRRCGEDLAKLRALLEPTPPTGTSKEGGEYGR